MKSLRINNKPILCIDCDESYSKFIDTHFGDIVACTRSLHEAKEYIFQGEIKVLLLNTVMVSETLTIFVKEILSLYRHTILIGLGNTFPAESPLSIESYFEYCCFVEHPLLQSNMHTILLGAIELFNVRKNQHLLHLKLKEEKLHALESDRLKANFLSNLSHEIRTPLNCILGFGSIIETSSCSDKMVKYNDLISNSCHRLLSVLEDLITSSKLHTGYCYNQVSSFDLMLFLKEIFYEFTPKLKEKQLDFSLKGVKDNGFIVSGDKDQLYEIFKQLLSNALKFTHLGNIEIGISDLNNFIFYVKDTGIGIAKDKQVEIFQTFNQGGMNVPASSYAGNGLGLSIVKGLLELVDGKIWVKSIKGMGATFFFQYPMNVVNKHNYERQ